MPSGDANICPACRQYILGYYCFHCKLDINEYVADADKDKDIKDLFNKLFGDRK